MTVYIFIRQLYAVPDPSHLDLCDRPVHGTGLPVHEHCLHAPVVVHPRQHRLPVEQRFVLLSYVYSLFKSHFILNLKYIQFLL